MRAVGIGTVTGAQTTRAEATTEHNAQRRENEDTNDDAHQGADTESNTQFKTYG